MKIETSAATPIAFGGLCGLAWAAGLRGFMTQIALDGSTVSWSGTFGWVLAPGLVIGMLLGWAEHIRRTGGRPHWRWLALAPLVFALLLFQDPGDILGIFEEGIGGAAIGIPLFAMVGGYAMSGRGPRWGRGLCGVLAASMVPIWAMTVESFAGPELVVSTPRGLWVALYLYTFVLLFMLASAIPHRPVVAADRPQSLMKGVRP